MHSLDMARALPYRAAVALLVCACLTSGCATTPKAFEIRGEADPVINRDAAGKPLSLAVRLYQLAKPDEFSKLTFDTVASGRPESELLGADLLEKTEVILVPGAKYTGSEKLREETKYVGVVGFFRQPDPHYWRFLVEADKIRQGGFAFRVRDCYLKVVGVAPYPIPGQPPDATPTCGSDTATLITAPAARTSAGSRRPPSGKPVAGDPVRP